MTEVIGVRFKKVGKVYYFDPCGVRAEKDAPVIVETARGLEYGEVAMSNAPVEDDRIVQPLKKLVRLATEADRVTMEQNLKFEQDAFRICEEKIARHKLEMKLVSAEYTFDHSKLLFYFSADGRVDFRELVKDLAGVFRTRIELRQIGVRDEAKMIGGLGICGRPLCCSSFLESFQPVSINMAKDQGLSLNPTKISGTCGRLMCCLKYENDAYQDLIRHTPPNESLVDTPYGRGTVLDSSLLRGTCRVRLQSNPDAPMTLHCDQCTVLRRGRDKGEPLELPEPPSALPPEAPDFAPPPAGEAPPRPAQRPVRMNSQPRRRTEGQPDAPETPREKRPGKPRAQGKKFTPHSQAQSGQARPAKENREAKPPREGKEPREGGRRSYRSRRPIAKGGKPVQSKPQPKSGE